VDQLSPPHGFMVRDDIVHWLAGTPARAWPRDEDWAAPRSVA
jgi:hypothetical protein